MAISAFPCGSWVYWWEHMEDSVRANLNNCAVYKKEGRLSSLPSFDSNCHNLTICSVLFYKLCPSVSIRSVSPPLNWDPASTSLPPATVLFVWIVPTIFVSPSGDVLTVWNQSQPFSWLILHSIHHVFLSFSLISSSDYLTPSSKFFSFNQIGETGEPVGAVYQPHEMQDRLCSPSDGPSTPPQPNSTIFIGTPLHQSSPKCPVPLKRERLDVSLTLCSHAQSSK